MAEETATPESKNESGQGTLSAEAYDAEDILSGAEPWDPVETKLVLWSFAVAILVLAVGGTLVNLYLLP